MFFETRISLYSIVWAFFCSEFSLFKLTRVLMRINYLLTKKPLKHLSCLAGERCLWRAVVNHLVRFAARISRITF